MKLTILLALLASMASTQAALNGPCTGGGLASGIGVCISTSSCTAGGGVVLNNLCPEDPENIKCCTKSGCIQPGGVCRFESTCTGNHLVIPGLCPGPANFECCQPCAPESVQSGGLGKRLPVC